MSQDPMPEFGLGPRDDLMRLRQLLEVVDPRVERIQKCLRGADLEHVQDDLGVFRIVLVPAVVQRLSRAGERDGRHELQIESRCSEGEHQRPVVVANCLKPN